MIKNFLDLAKRFWPILVLAVLEIILFAANYKPGTYLVGWDNLYPELNFAANFKRNIFAVWQEYRGLGLLDGMAYAANLPHTLFLWILHFFLPQSFIRYFFIFLMHFLGGVGVYFLLKRQILKSQANQQASSFLGALFYLLNLGTIQMFYAPLEVFAVHFAVLPWLALSILNYLDTPNRRNLALFIVFSILALPQGFVPQIFLAYILLVFFLLLTFLIRQGLKALKQVLVILAIIFSVNAVWLLSYVYAAPRNASMILEAKINQMSSDDIYLKNKFRGSLTDVVFLKGFMLDVSEYVKGDKEPTFPYIMEGWRKHTESVNFQISAWLFFLVAAGGLTSALVTRKKYLFPFAAAFLTAGAFLGSDIWGLSFLTDLFRGAFPVLGEAFRFPFTKFITLFILGYAVFFAWGLSLLVGWLKRLTSRGALFTRGFLALGAVLLILYALPVFKGGFFFDSLRLKIPPEYQAAIDFFKKEDKATRIATLPQPSFWNWRFYNWGYRGSGFLWYGTEQPMLVRAFDPWSRQNENYYWELVYAINSENQKLFGQVLEKYQVHWLLLDESLISPASPKALYLKELKEILGNSEKISLAQSFGKIKIYKVRLESPVQNFVFLAQNLPQVEPVYKWNNFDRAYLENGNYTSSFRNSSLEIRNSEYYPFRSLFTGQPLTDIELEITPEQFVFRKILPPELKDSLLLTPEVGHEELMWVDPADLSKVRYLRPEVQFSGEKLEVFVPRVGGYFSAEINPADETSVQKAKNCKFTGEGEVKNEVIQEGKENFLRLTALNTTNCSAAFWLPSLNHKNAYLVTVESRHLAGKSLLFWLDNLKKADLEAYLPKYTSSEVSYFIQPPVDEDGVGYSLHFDNISIGRQKSVNDLGKITVNPIPYSFLTGLKLVKSDEDGGQPKLLPVEKVEHLNPSLYKVQLPATGYELTATLVLSQAYHEGWKAYKMANGKWQIANSFKAFFPFFFGEELKEHVLVNNWANGWVIEAQSAKPPTLLGLRGAGKAQNDNLNFKADKIVIVFWPQYLEYLGFVLLIAIPLIIFWRWK